MTANGTTAPQINDPFPGVRFQMIHSFGFFYLKTKATERLNIKRKEQKVHLGYTEKPILILYLKCLGFRCMYICLKTFPHTIRLKGTPERVRTTGLRHSNSEQTSKGSKFWNCIYINVLLYIYCILLRTGGEESPHLREITNLPSFIKSN